jgi:hypothetical protein
MQAKEFLALLHGYTGVFSSSYSEQFMITLVLMLTVLLYRLLYRLDYLLNEKARAHFKISSKQPSLSSSKLWTILSL